MNCTKVWGAGPGLLGARGGHWHKAILEWLYHGHGKKDPIQNTCNQNHSALFHKRWNPCYPSLVHYAWKDGICFNVKLKIKAFANFGENTINHWNGQLQKFPLKHTRATSKMWHDYELAVSLYVQPSQYKTVSLLLEPPSTQHLTEQKIN
jgi:hypothetical protein